MISEASANLIRQALERARGDPSAEGPVTVALEEVDELLALYAEAEGVDPDSMTDGQKVDAALEAIHRVLPQYRPVKCEIGTEERGGVGVSVLRLHLEWEMT